MQYVTQNHKLDYFFFLFYDHCETKLTIFPSCGILAQREKKMHTIVLVVSLLHMMTSRVIKKQLILPEVAITLYDSFVLVFLSFSTFDCRKIP